VDDLLFKGMNAIHRGILTLSGGRLGWDFMRMPTLELTTTGRKSGQARSVMLTSPVQEGDTIVVVASRGGDDRHPAWYHNVKADPAVEVRWKGGPRRPMQARVATAEERARLWPLVVERYSGYGQYQTKTEREIPLVLLDPAPAPPAG
jgi:deazaflavin-dependent oxidoreductase (nitroreductase family)